MMNNESYVVGCCAIDGGREGISVSWEKLRASGFYV